jgi:hypothetical protein
MFETIKTFKRNELSISTSFSIKIMNSLKTNFQKFSFMKLSLILNVIDPKIGGVMIMGECELKI